MDQTEKKSNKTLWTIVVLAIAAVTFGAIKLGDKKVDAPVNTDAVDTSEEASSTQPTTYLYKDGTYTAVGKYTSPAGPEEVEVNLTLKNDVISTATIVSKATHEVSVKLQRMFIGGASVVVMGRNLDDVVLDKVAGSSLTPKGWNDAIAQIQVQAKI